jgi:hypothetical protein
MKVTYDPVVDVLRILFRDAPVEESDEASRASSSTTTRMAISSGWKC